MSADGEVSLSAHTGDYASAVKGVFMHVVSKAATPQLLPNNERMSQLDPEPPG